MGFSQEKGDFHVCNGSAGQHTLVGLFLQVGENQLLIVDIQHVRGAPGVKHQTAPLGQGLQKKMDLCIVAQRLKMPYPLHRIFDGLPVVDFGVSQLHLQRKPLRNQAFEDFLLDFSHDLGVNLPRLPQNVKHRVLFFQLPQLGKDGHRVGAGRQGNPVGHDRLHYRWLTLRLSP